MPAQAFQGQNHDAHIEAHFSMMHSTVVKSSPIVMANLQAHIMQHISLKAQEEIQQEVMAQMQQLPPEQQQMMQQQAIVTVQQVLATGSATLNFTVSATTRPTHVAGWPGGTHPADSL